MGRGVTSTPALSVAESNPYTLWCGGLSLATEGLILGYQSGSPSKTHTFSIRTDPERQRSNSSSLVPSETNSHPLDVQSHAQELIHGRVEYARFRIICAMHLAPEGPLTKRAARMGLCCVSPQICVEKGERPVCIAGYCRDRMCPTCSRRRAARVRLRIQGLVCAMNAPRFLTLTARDDGRGLGNRLDELWNAVKKLRRTDVWKRHVRGGVIVPEVKYNKAAGTWHPHFHIIIDGGFFPHALLHAEWKRLLGRDGTCDLKAIHDRAAAARYIGGYLGGTAGKKDPATDPQHWPDEIIREYAQALNRRRLIATFGTSHAVNLDLCDKEPERPKIPSTVIGFAQLRDAIITGVEPARKAAPLLAMLGGAWRQLFIEFAPLNTTEADVLTDTHSEQLADWINSLSDGLDAEPEPEPPPPHDFRGQLDLELDTRRDQQRYW